MRFSRLVSLAVLAFPLTLAAQSREIRELQRDFGIMIMDVREFQRAQNEKIAEIKTLLEQALDVARRNTTSIALMEREMKDMLAEQQKSVATPVVGLNAKIDSLTNEFSFLKESVNVTNERLSRLQTQVVDLGNQIQIMQAPPAPPSGLPDLPPAGLSGETLFQDASRDLSRGNLDLAMTGFSGYVKWFPATDQACEAQYFIGEIHSRKGENKQAIEAFDLVLEKYPSSCSKKADARFMKGKSLVSIGDKTAAAAEFDALLEAFPKGEWAKKAQAELRALGFRR